MASQQGADGTPVPVQLSKPDWKGLLKWSLQQSDPSQPPRELSEEDKKWLLEAMQASSIDITKRMKEITSVISTPRDVLMQQGVTGDDIGGILEELQEHVEDIDMANDMRAIGGLDPLIRLLKDDDAPIRARAAEVISTVVHNNPKGQKDVMEHQGLEALVSNFQSDPDVVARTKALGAISSLIRHNDPAAAAFRLAGGLASLKTALASDDKKLQRKALQVTNCMLQQNSKDNLSAVQLGFPRLLLSLASSKEADIREAALRSLQEVISHSEAGWGAEADELKSLLRNRIDMVQNEAAENTPKEERLLLDALWSSCFGEPSVLREKGMLILPEEEAPPPDVVGHIFEPPLRGLQAQLEAAQAESRQPPLLLKM